MLRPWWGVVCAVCAALAALCLLLGSPGAARADEEPREDVPPPAGMLNVQEWGARGDGTADDTAALQSALQAAGKPDPRRPGQVVPTVLFFPPGVYRVTATLKIGWEERVTRLMGSGGFLIAGDLAQTAIRYDGPEGEPLVDCWPYSGLRLEELQLHGGDKAGVLLRINSAPGWGASNFFVERVSFTNADTGIETGAEMDMCASDMSFLDLNFDQLKTAAFRTMGNQNVDYVFIRCSVGRTPVGYHFERGGNGHFLLPTFYRVNTGFLIESGGINAGTFSVTGLQLENFRYEDPKRRITLVDARGEVNMSFNSLFVGCINVWGPEADLETPNFVLGPRAQVTVRDSMISGRVATLTGLAGDVATWIQFDNCRFRCASDPRTAITCDEMSGFELRNCNVTLDDTQAEDYGATLRPLFIQHYLRLPEGLPIVK